MDNNRVSLIRKIIAKGSILSPFEAIHLKYLSRRGLLEELVNIEREENPYTAAEDAHGTISPYYVNYLVGRTLENDPDLYRSYNYAYESLLHQDSTNEKLGYKGLMLLIQLRLLKLEHKQAMSQGKFISFMQFQSFSPLHYRYATYEEVLGALGNTFRYFLKDVDNILTLNFYLNQLIDVNELSCLKLLKMWLNPENYKGSKVLHEASLCCDEEHIQFLLDENHANYAESISRHIKNLPISFAESSLEYVKDVIEKTIMVGSNPNA